MKLPREVPIMTLPNVTLFPQALLPLYIFEPHYRQMLSDALHSTRMFCVAMHRPGPSLRPSSPIAGLGLIRVCVGHKNGTSHLILQGLARVELGRALQSKPYRIHRVSPLTTPPCDTVAADALMAKLRELLQERFDLGLPFPSPFLSQSGSKGEATPFSGQEVLGYLDAIADPEQAADLVSCAVLPDALERQIILETVDVETRLRRLIRFLIQELCNHRKDRRG